MEYSFNDSVGFHLNRVANILRVGFSKCLEAYNIAPEQYGTLEIVSKDGDITQSEIAEILGKGKPTIGRALDALEKKGFIVRAQDSEDRRVKPIHLTEQGHELLAEVTPKAQAFNDAIKAKISPEETKIFLHLLDIIAETAADHHTQQYLGE